MRPRSRRSARWRRATTTSALALCLAFALVASAPVTADAGTTVLGRGMAYSTVLAAGPVAGRLSLAVTAGESIVEYRGSTARAESRTVDPGLLGTGLTANPCDGSPPLVTESQLPQPLVVDSHQPGAAAGRTAGYAQAPPGAPVGGGVGQQQVWATGEPRGRAVTRMGALGVPGLLDASGGRAEAETAGPGRSATATVSVPALDLLGGVVRLEGLRWEVSRNETGNGPGGTTTHAAFTMGRVVLAGQSFPGPTTPAGTVALVQQLNALLAPTGLVVDLPHVVRTLDGMELTPLMIRVDHTPLGSQTVGPVLSALMPLREPLFDALLKASCRLATAVLVGDVLTGVASGSGALEVGVGGVYAGTGEIHLELLTAPAAETGVPASAQGTPDVVWPTTDATPGGGGAGAGATLPEATAAVRAPGPAGRLGEETATASARQAGSRRRGASLLAALAGLLGVLAVAGADGLRMRRTGRAIEEEES